MKLDTYIRESGVTEQELADKVGYSQGTINKLRNGKINPTMQLLTKIAEATKHLVTPNDFLPPFRGDESAPCTVGPEAPAQEAAPAEEVTGAAS